MFSVHYMVLRGFYAIEDTRTPFFIQCVVAAVNVGLAIALTSRLRARCTPPPALALAYGAAYTAGAVLSTRILARRIGGLDTAELRRFVVRVAVAIPAGRRAHLVDPVGTRGALGLDVASRLDALVMLMVGGGLGLMAYSSSPGCSTCPRSPASWRLLRPTGTQVRQHPTASTPKRLRWGRTSGETDELGTRREAGQEGRGSTLRRARRPCSPSGTSSRTCSSEEGEATTWRARDRVLARSVVLQIIPSSLPSRGRDARRGKARLPGRRPSDPAGPRCGRRRRAELRRPGVDQRTVPRGGAGRGSHVGPKGYLPDAGGGRRDLDSPQDWPAAPPARTGHDHLDQVERGQGARPRHARRPAYRSCRGWATPSSPTRATSVGCSTRA